ncbi:MAG: hypothetical protein WB579_12515 [Bryobacteraceae bacterium]
MAGRIFANMVVGDTHSIQATNLAGQPVTGLTWTSSDPSIVSLSGDAPPLLTALAVGHATITGGTATAAVTVFAGTPPLGTVIWSNPGDGSGVQSIVPAVPSTSGVADVFAFQNDGTVQAITSDGTTAWTANVSYESEGGVPEFQSRVRRPKLARPSARPRGPVARDSLVMDVAVPDFQGGLVVMGQNSIWKLDGITGLPYPAFACDPFTCGGLAVHPDGTIFTMGPGLIGIDPTTGAQKFMVPLTGYPDNVEFVATNPMIAGDGYAYVAYVDADELGQHEELRVLRVNNSGAHDDIKIADWMGPQPPWGMFEGIDQVSIITIADTGVLLAWDSQDQPLDLGVDVSLHMAVTTGTSVALVSAPQVPGGDRVVPVLQAQDGSFVGTFWDPSGTYIDMAAFDATGNVRWTVPNEQPQIATADGGVIGQSGITYDQNGNATGQISLATYSWLGYAYQDGPVTQVVARQLYAAESFWPFAGANNSGNGTAASQPQYPPLPTCTATQGCVGPREAIYNALADLIVRLSAPAVSGAAQSKVFSLLGTDSNGVPLTTQTFIAYLTKKKPGFYDGLRSTFCIGALVPWSTPCWLPIFSSESVATFLSDPSHSDTDALTGTPSNPLLTFFRPASILYPNLGNNLGNEGTIFHEALHGFTGAQDQSILTMLGYGNVFNTASCNITTYIQQEVLIYSSGLDPNVAPCPPAPSPPAN